MSEPTICFDCMTWHTPPRCRHNPEALCPQCGEPFGYLAGVQVDTGVCWRCSDELHKEEYSN